MVLFLPSPSYHGLAPFPFLYYSLNIGRKGAKANTQTFSPQSSPLIFQVVLSLFLLFICPCYARRLSHLKNHPLKPLFSLLSTLLFPSYLGSILPIPLHSLSLLLSRHRPLDLSPSFFLLFNYVPPSICPPFSCCCCCCCCGRCYYCWQQLSYTSFSPSLPSFLLGHP